MLAPPLAFGWLLWRQHGRTLALALAVLTAVAVASALLPAYCSRAAAEWGFGAALLFTAPCLTLIFIVFVAGGERGDVLGRESLFPAGHLRLPLPTGSLVVWPLTFGALAALVLWPALAWFILQPWLSRQDEIVALGWPALMAAATLAWVQALCWTGFGLRWVRMIFLTVLPPLFGALVGFTLIAGFSEGMVAVLLACLAAPAWGLAYVGVRRARRGAVPDWDAILSPLRRLAAWLPRRRARFASAAAAQCWYEWRLTGWSLAAAVGLVLPWTLLPLWLGDNDVLPVEHTLLSTLLVPLLFAGGTGIWPETGRNRWVKNQSAMMTYVATLPLSSAGLVAAMLKIAACSALAGWLVLLLSVPVAVVLTGNVDATQAAMQGWAGQAAGGAALLSAAVAALLFVASWKRRVDSLYLGVTGHSWITSTLVFAYIGGCVALPIGASQMYQKPEARTLALALLPWLLGPLLLCRLLVATWALRELLTRRLLTPAALARWLAVWVFVAAALFALLLWTLTPQALPVQWVAFAVLFAMPMGRLSALPLVVAWQRHGRLPPRAQAAA